MCQTQSPKRNKTQLRLYQRMCIGACMSSCGDEAENKKQQQKHLLSEICIWHQQSLSHSHHLGLIWKIKIKTYSKILSCFFFFTHPSLLHYYIIPPNISIFMLLLLLVSERYASPTTTSCCNARPGSFFELQPSRPLHQIRTTLWSSSSPLCIRWLVSWPNNSTAALVCFID